jgi:hypothetical protein
MAGDGSAVALPEGGWFAGWAGDPGAYEPGAH